MIRGAEQGFKFTTSFDFDEIDNIVAVFSQSNNNGTITAPMPISKYYNKVAPVSGGAATSWPLVASDINKVYKCEQSYYQYDPDEDVWNITEEMPSPQLTNLAVGSNSVPANAIKKNVYVYQRCYYKYDTSDEIWRPTFALVPIVDVDYWDGGSQADTSKIYLAKETYYKYYGGAWHASAVDDRDATCVPEWNSSDTSGYDASKIYCVTSKNYTYNALTGELTEGEDNVTYYRNESGDEWVEFANYTTWSEADPESVTRWSTEDKNTDKVYVCRNAYYTYKDTAWTEPTEDDVSAEVVEIDTWDEDDYHDTDKIYTCPPIYYKYNSEEEQWEHSNINPDVDVVERDYFTDITNLDKAKIYLCGVTYFYYDSDLSQWLTSSAFDMGALRVMRNDGFYQVDGDPKSFVSMLSAEETMRFNELYKGSVQATVYSRTANRTDKSMVIYFPVYPTMTDDTFSTIPSAGAEIVHILDAGAII